MSASRLQGFKTRTIKIVSQLIAHVRRFHKPQSMFCSPAPCTKKQGHSTGLCTRKHGHSTSWPLYMEARTQHWPLYKEARTQHWPLYKEARTQHWPLYEEARTHHCPCTRKHGHTTGPCTRKHGHTTGLCTRKHGHTTGRRVCSAVLPRVQVSTDAAPAPRSHACRKALGLQRGPGTTNQIHQYKSRYIREDSPGTLRKKK